MLVPRLFRIQTGTRIAARVDLSKSRAMGSETRDGDHHCASTVATKSEHIWESSKQKANIFSAHHTSNIA